ncbi:MAG: flavin reductase family protein [Rhodospirillaceae bacterium]
MTMKVDERSFRKALGCFASGVAVVTSVGADKRLVGVTVSAFTSVSLDPPLVLFCLDRRNTSLDAFTSGHFAINILQEDQRQVSIQFASRLEDKWQGIAFEVNEHGVPLISETLARLECSVHELVEGGDHLIVIGKVDSLDYKTGGQPLLYFRGAYANISECF